jgi:hypothetical protein
VNNFFDQFKDAESGDIIPEGMSNLIGQLGLLFFCFFDNCLGYGEEDLYILIFAWKAGAKKHFTITREEFIRGCTAFGFVIFKI